MMSSSRRLRWKLDQQQMGPADVHLRHERLRAREHIRDHQLSIRRLDSRS